MASTAFRSSIHAVLPIPKGGQRDGHDKLFFEHANDALCREQDLKTH